MKKLGELWEDDICTWREIPNIQKIPISRKRKRVACVIKDEKEKVSLNFYRGIKKGWMSSLHAFPGGGVEEGEELQEALRREIREEVGVEMKNIQEIGFVIEHRTNTENIKRVYQESCFFSAEVSGEKKRILTENEIRTELKNNWFDGEDIEEKFLRDSHDFHKEEGLIVWKETKKTKEFLYKKVKVKQLSRKEGSDKAFDK